MKTTFDRRVYRREFCEILGYRIGWMRAQEKRGAIPPGRRDPGGKRLWWFESEVREVIARLAASPHAAPQPGPPQVAKKAAAGLNAQLAARDAEIAALREKLAESESAHALTRDRIRRILDTRPGTVALQVVERTRKADPS